MSGPSSVSIGAVEQEPPFHTFPLIQQATAIDENIASIIENLALVLNFDFPLAFVFKPPSAHDLVF